MPVGAIEFNDTAVRRRISEASDAVLECGDSSIYDQRDRRPLEQMSETPPLDPRRM